MSMNEVIPMLESLSHTDKFKLAQIILAQLAQEEGISLPISMSQERDSLFDIIGMAEGEETDVSQQHDKYLYGTP